MKREELIELIKMGKFNEVFKTLDMGIDEILSGMARETNITKEDLETLFLSLDAVHCALCKGLIDNVKSLRVYKDNGIDTLFGEEQIWLYGLCGECSLLPDAEERARAIIDGNRNRILHEACGLMARYSCPKCSDDIAYVEYTPQPGKRLTFGYCTKCKVYWEIQNTLGDDERLFNRIHEAFWDVLDEADPGFDGEWEFVEHNEFVHGHPGTDTVN